MQTPGQGWVQFNTHAPAYLGELESFQELADPRAAAEVVSRTGLGCILLGLSRSPAMHKESGIFAKDLDAIVLPEGCSLGIPALSAVKNGVALVLVRDNSSAVGVNINSFRKSEGVTVKNYAEALAYIISRRAQISWESIIGEIKSIKKL